MDRITWTVVARESAFDQLKLDLKGPHLLTRTPRDKIRHVLGESDVILVELEQSGHGFDFKQAAQYGLPVPFLLRCDVEGQYIGVCRFGLHKEIFDALNSVGEWWELRAGRSRPYEVFRKLLNRVSDGIAELDATDKIRWVNTTMKQALPNLKWAGAQLQDVVREEDRHRLSALRAQHGAGVVVPFAVHLLRRGGRRRADAQRERPSSRRCPRARCDQASTGWAMGTSRRLPPRTRGRLGASPRPALRAGCGGWCPRRRRRPSPVPRLPRGRRWVRCRCPPRRGRP